MKKYFLIALKVLIALAIFSWFGFLLSHKIDLTTADLGRHIENGYLILHGSSADRNGILHTNFYSYTLPNQPFVNHHWGSGVVFYLIYSWFGFVGLSVFYLILGLLTLWLFFDVARKSSNFWIGCTVTIILIPLIASRAEIRPEIFSYFFTGLFLWVLYSWRYGVKNNIQQVVNGKIIWLLPILMLVWVNLHIGFVFGFLVLFAFLMQQLFSLLLYRTNQSDPRNPSTLNYEKSNLTIQSPQLEELRGRRIPFISNIFQERDPSPSAALGVWMVFRHSKSFSKYQNKQRDVSLGSSKNVFEPDQKTKKDFLYLVYISLGCIVCALFNPSFIKGFLYPLTIFKNYGYLIVENQSIKFLENLKFTNGQHFLLFKLVSISAIILFIVGAIKNWRKIDFVLLILVLVSSVLAYLGIRHFPSFALFAIPAISSATYNLWPKKIHPAYQSLLCLIVIVIIIVSVINQYQDFLRIKPALGFGLYPGVQASAAFFKSNNIKGPIFNNYDIGGYLIFNLAGENNGYFPVFIDNRPEAYSVDFLQKIYILAQSDPKKWEELDRQYNFNSIFFSYRDYTPWAQSFLIAKVTDPLWAPVYVDGYNIIFVKRNVQNQELISKYELPKSTFGIK
jgi:hypothetical protein